MEIMDLDICYKFTAGNNLLPSSLKVGWSMWFNLLHSNDEIQTHDLQLTCDLHD